jgi:hypothetical protein
LPIIIGRKKNKTRQLSQPLGGIVPDIRAVICGTEDIDTSLTYYLSGPMNGIPDNNFPAFERATWTLRHNRLTIISPHELKVNLKNDLMIMLGKCEGLILLRGWPQSVGAGVELNLALALKWPIFYYDQYRLNAMNNIEEEKS